ncbi:MULTISPECIES: UDP-N-acetylmuramate dehydrogenase [unclassified Corynebacterium]|uniref:UDP-N-acetylmuramate dehydrogenase n=1 Tax=unclassified Corynebacterium TaxID=2624378 RepID=UPI0029CA45E1|nr:MULTISPECIES: UDP-N-acetylmuramate dehydrogenase [unclassified Corynebacterium]WPF66378.1 UDP-N-acetylmuramate dehydrogenase [Corynebacterium sp. 22KM0430]WPF68868.1 UDP-N-acetylmuramate dehydrogenase [Corynebacterium sp. 21KM1197]
MSDVALTQRLNNVHGATCETSLSLAELTTLRLGGRPRFTVRCATAEATAEVVRVLDEAGVPLLIVGGGSNLVVADGDLDLAVVLLEDSRVHIDRETGLVRAAAGAVWDDVVRASVEAGLGGLECLSGIPGCAGATPVQNVGAYGVEVSDVLTRVRLWDRGTEKDEWVSAKSLDLGYRYSNLKFTNRAVVLEVEFQLSTDGLSAPLRFGALAREVGATEPGQRLPARQVREAVLRVRRGKAMVLDAEDHDTWSAGSFFTNPVVSEALADAAFAKVGEETMPRFPAGEGKVKLSAAWLIERAGFPRGYPGEGAPVRLSTRHTLALTNRGGAKTVDLVSLAREVIAGVKGYFGIELVSEPVWVGAKL